MLRDIGHQLYHKKASTVLGSFHGRPTVICANGYLCIGTDIGHVLVFDFKQQLKCFIDPNNPGELFRKIRHIDPNIL